MFGAMKSHISEELKQINDNGLYKAERIITSPQNAMITIQSGQKVLNLCANNYLGLADHPDVIQAAQDSFAKWYKATMLIQGGMDLTPLITHSFHYTEYLKAFEIMRSGNSGKVILNWTEE